MPGSCGGPGVQPGSHLRRAKLVCVSAHQPDLVLRFPDGGQLIIEAKRAVPDMEALERAVRQLAGYVRAARDGQGHVQYRVFVQAPPAKASAQALSPEWEIG